MNFAQYRQPTQIECIYTYTAPEGKHWECCGVNYGKIIWASYQMDNPYELIQDKEEKGMK